MQRLIDAYAFKKENERLLHCDFPYLSETTLEELIDEAPTIDVEPQWIPCSERLPEKDGYYLTTTCYRQVYCDFWNEDHFDRTEAVIAWMPLPEPYEVKE